VNGFVPIYAGLKEGERYVVAGSFVLKAELGKAGAAHEH
jgi:cobalt-zinc-cadmium efflux system membrane fusion protein